ncbi:MAG: hypothetical protein ABRQ26_16495 [Syntrophomonadaceae bacterium]
MCVKIVTRKKPAGKNAKSGKAASHHKQVLIIVRGTRTRFDWVHDLDELLLKLLYVVAVCVLIWIFT